MEIRPVELVNMLDAREHRAFRQMQLLNCFPGALICFTMNIAGPIKNSDLIQRAFCAGLSALKEQLTLSGVSILHEEVFHEFTGNEAFLCTDRDAEEIKHITAQIEEFHPLGRLFDMDVLRTDYSKVERQEIDYPPRACLICGLPARECASRRIHSVDTLQRATHARMEKYFNSIFADQIATLATKALLYEVAATPKPGLVDRISNGAHADMDFYTFLSSAGVLTPYLRDMTLTGIRTADQPPRQTFEGLKYHGIAAEQAMRKATHGVNTHKGAIYSIGLLCGAAGRLYGIEKALNAAELTQECTKMVREDYERYLQCRDIPNATHGQRIFLTHGLTGVRGEAAKGFLSVLHYGLPVLEASLAEGKNEDEASCAALISLMAHTTDTNIIARSDVETHAALQERLIAGLERFGVLSPDMLLLLDQELTLRNLSPGGCADLLAVSWLLHFLATDLGKC